MQIDVDAFKWENSELRAEVAALKRDKPDAMALEEWRRKLGMTAPRDPLNSMRSVEFYDNNGVLEWLASTCDAQWEHTTCRYRDVKDAFDAVLETVNSGATAVVHMCAAHEVDGVMRWALGVEGSRPQIFRAQDEYIIVSYK